MVSKLVVFDLDDTLIDTSGQLSPETVWDNLKELELLDGAREFLVDFPARKILVTKERMEGLQKAKLDKLGIFDLFEKVIVCTSNKEKSNYFRKIAEENNKVEIWAVGDRIDSEIRYANEWGWKTVLVKRGKYKTLNVLGKSYVSDYEIDDLFELGNLLK